MWIILLLDGKSRSVYAVAWRRQATSHCLCQCWPIYMSPYCVNRPNMLMGYNYLQKQATILQTACEIIIQFLWKQYYTRFVDNDLISTIHFIVLQMLLQLVNSSQLSLSRRILYIIVRHIFKRTFLVIHNLWTLGPCTKQCGNVYDDDRSTSKN